MNLRLLPFIFCIPALFIIVHIASLPAAADTTGEGTPLAKHISLAGPWKIITGDDDRYTDPGLNVDSWDEINLPGNLIRYSKSKGKGVDGVLWIRKRIHVDKELSGEPMGLSLGRIGNADETFFNGEKVGSTGSFPPREHSMWNFPRHYMVPAKLIKYGEENVVAVRISYYIFGELLGNPEFLPYAEWKFDADMAHFLRITMSFFIIAMGTTLFIIFAIFYIRQPDETVYFYYALQLVVGFFVVFELCINWRIFPTTLLRFKVLALSWIALNVAHPIFLHRFYDLKRKWTERFLWTYLACAVFIAVFLVHRSNADFYFLLVTSLTMNIGLYNISCHISALYKKRPYSGMFSFFGIAVILGALHDGVVYLGKGFNADFHIGGYHFNDMYFPYSAMALYTGIALVLVSRSIDMTKRIEELNVNLEASVEERTGQLKEALKELESKNMQLSDMALRDGLTGLFNHAAIHDRLAAVMNESQRIGFPLCVAMLDLDNFKGLNDRYGHQLGDMILVKVAHIMKGELPGGNGPGEEGRLEMQESVIRAYDVAGRYGGDEFIMGLPYCDEEKAVSIANRLRMCFEEIHFDDFPGVQVRGSFGIAVLYPEMTCPDIKDLVALADIALYKSKAGGKNRISIIHYFSDKGTSKN